VASMQTLVACDEVRLMPSSLDAAKMMVNGLQSSHENVDFGSSIG
jgi:hypothetical protein